MRRQPSALLAADPAYFEMLHAMFRADPASVHESWRAVFLVVDDLMSSIAGGGSDGQFSVEALRQSGHRLADINPLEGSRREAVLQHPDAMGRLRHAEVASPVHARLRDAYLGALTIETGHIDDPEVRSWLLREFEGPRADLRADLRLRALDQLLRAEEFERFLGNKAPTKKRFGAEGAESVLPLLLQVIRSAASQGVQEIVIATMHRGRLNLMVNVLEQDPVDAFYAFQGNHPFPQASDQPADVPYHLGFEQQIEIDGHRLRISLCPNPSHLEAVNPVCLGRVRARQDLRRREGSDPAHVLGIALHTDASVIGQGSVSELVQLGQVGAFGTGGTIHLIVNNQIGFTTEPSDARSSLHCTGIWKAVDSAILHVNGDDPDAVLQAADLSVAFRQSQRRDAVIDLVCYRRRGHNELDEPTFTQPRLYERIDRKPTVAASYGERLIAAGLTTAEAIETQRSTYRAHLQEAYELAATPLRNSGSNGGAPDRDISAESTVPAADTGLPVVTLESLMARITTIPDTFSAHPKVRRILTQRSPGSVFAWPHAEALAIASLLDEGIDVRLTGQDVERGAFSTRHFVLHDTATGNRLNRLQQVAQAGAVFHLANSPLSENAVLGFEYGYSVERPDALVIWEAQFGDFANCAQVIIDQFISSAEAKWQQTSKLVVFLPHGLEGQGPEHSSARIERLLQLCGDNNIRVAAPSTPANFFHLLRRQSRSTSRKPLFVFSPKTLLRLPQAVSEPAEMGPGTGFLPLIFDPPSEPVRRVILCSGKLGYALAEERKRRGATGVAILRLEQFYPFPESPLCEAFAPYAKAEFVWAQEEPANMGAWTWLDRRLEAVLRRIGAEQGRFVSVARPEAASPAGSFHYSHDADQIRLIARAFDEPIGIHEEAAA